MSYLDEAHPLMGCLGGEGCGPDDMFGPLRKLQKLNPRLPDQPARQNSADALTIPRRRGVSAEGVDVLINQPLVGAGINELANSTIGLGRRLKPQFNGKRLGWTDKQVDKLVDEVKCLWKEHMESKRKWIDQEGDQTLAEMQRMVLTQTLATGDCYTLNYWFDDPGRPFKTALGIIDVDRVRTPQDLTMEQKKTTVAGHAKGPSGRTNAYYIHDWHRNDPRNWIDEGTEKYTLVRRHNEFGREQVIHTYLKKLPGMTRGLSALAPAFNDLKCLDKYKQTRMEAAIAQLAMAVVVKSNDKNILASLGSGPNMGDPDEMMRKMYAASIKHATQSQALLNNNGLNFDGARFIRLLESEEAEILTSNQAGINDEQFVKDCLSPVARSIGMSEATLTQNFETSYSAARATLLSFYRQCENYGKSIVDDWLLSVYASWLEDVILTGQISIPRLADPFEAWTDFVTKREWYCEAVFAGPARDQIDQSKEMDYWTKVRSIGGFTYQEFYDSHGFDWQDKIKQQFTEMKFIEDQINEAGLTHIDPLTFMVGKIEPPIVEQPQPQPEQASTDGN